MDAACNFEPFCKTASFVDPNLCYNNLSLIPDEDIVRRRAILYGAQSVSA